MLLLAFLAHPVFAQETFYVSSLDNTINETSGIINLNNHFITFNDSGGENKLYEFDVDTGNILREVEIVNARNTDWEALTFDDEHIYIGDIGNNLGNRTDLKIYKVKIEDFFDESLNNRITAQVININFLDQIDYESQRFYTNFDSEAFVALDNHLFLFTKNWGDEKSTIYKVPKSPGFVNMINLGTIDVDGLITDATLNKDNNLIVLCGYTPNSNFIIEMDFNFFDGNFSFEIFRHDIEIPSQASDQIEGIAYFANNEYYLTSEKSFGREAALLTHSINYSLSDILNENIDTEIVTFPNPVNNNLNVLTNHFKTIEIYDLNGSLIFKSNIQSNNLEHLEKGNYIAIITKENNDFEQIKIVKN